MTTPYAERVNGEPIYAAHINAIQNDLSNKSYDIASANFGAVGDGSTSCTDAFLSASASLALLGGGTILVPVTDDGGDYLIDDDLEFSDLVQVQFQKGAKFTISTGCTVSNIDLMAPPMSQIFDGAGTVELGGVRRVELYPEWWGAVGDDSTDCRTAIQATGDACNAAGGGYITFGIGTYVVSKGASHPCISWSGYENVHFRGAGIGATVIKRKAATYPGDTHIFQCKTFANNVSFEDMTLDGNRANCVDGDEQRHLLYISGQSDAVNYVWVNRCEFINSRGDGIFILGSIGDDPSYTIQKLWITNSKFYNNGRSGIACQRGLSWFWIENNYFEAIDDQSIDMEATGAGSAHDGFIIGNKIYHNNYTEALAFAPGGVGTSDRMKRMTIADNDIYGGSVLCGHMEDVTWRNNRIYGQTNARALDIRDVLNFRLEGGYLEGNCPAEPVFNISRVGGSVIDVSVEGATFVQNEDDGGGIGVSAFDKGLNIKNNTLKGAAGSSGINVAISETNDTVTRYDLAIDGNDVRNFAEGVFVFSPNGATKLNTCSISGNKFWDDQTVATQVKGIILDSNSSHWVENQSLTIANNVNGRGTATPLSFPTVAFPIICIGGMGSGTVAISQWATNASPEGVITAPVGSTALNYNGGATTTFYVKTSGSGNTGWTGK